MSEKNDRFKELNFELHRNIRYNDIRRGWFMKWYNIINLFNVIFSCGAIASFAVATKHTWLPFIPSLIVAIANGINLVYDLRGRGYEFTSFFRKYHQILEKLTSQEADNVLNDEQLSKLEKEYHSIHKDESVVNLTLNIMAFNDTILQLYGEDSALAESELGLKHVEISWVQRFIANWLDTKK